MGLDMYLRARLHVSQYFNDEWKEEVKGLTVPWPGVSNAPGYFSMELEKIVAYWRKANAIHKWFVDNCAKGEDNCQRVPVDTSELEQLVRICKLLLEDKDPDKAKEMLPPQPGFFFGSTEVDEWYWQDLEETVKQIEAILSHEEVHRFDYTYQASW